MKNEIPKPVVFAIAAVVLAGAVFLLLRNAGGTETISVEPKKAENYIEGIPDYVKQGRAPTANELPKGLPNQQQNAPAGTGQ